LEAGVAGLVELHRDDGAALVRTEQEGLVLRLTLQNPPANALSIEVMECLQARLEAARDDETVRVVVLRSAGSLFSAGHDLKELTTHRADADRGRGFFEQTFALCARLIQTIVNSPLPVIAEVGGIATAAGCQLVASCDLAFASEHARFGVNGIDVGLFCTTPAVALMRSVALKRAMEMLLTGEMIDAVTACDIGLVNRVVPSGLLAAAVNDCAHIIAGKSPVAVRLGKQAVYAQVGLRLAEAYELASRTMIENMMAPDAEEGIGAFLNRRLPKE
jgi:enoyl-CoA hydratase/carnithine racemase